MVIKIKKNKKNNESIFMCSSVYMTDTKKIKKNIIKCD